MEKSIETIWKEGFMHDNALVVPRINDLYNRKSTDIVDKLQRMFRVNLLAITIAIIAIPVVTGAIEFGGPFTGVETTPFIFFPALALSALLAVLVRIRRQEMLKLEQFDKGQTSYQYLKVFVEWRRASFQRYSRFYQLFYPLFFLLGDAVLWFSFGSKIAAEAAAGFPEEFVAQHISTLWLIGTVLGTGLAAWFAKPLYQLDVNLVYGQQFEKLDEIIADMEELRE
jgi:hypothetical protein